MTTSADINITDATAVLVSGAGGSDSYALYTNENITVTNSKLDLSSADVSGNSYAMQTGGGKKLSVTNSEITATSGAGKFSLPIWTSSAELKDSTVTAAGGTASCESYGMSAGGIPNGRRYGLPQGRRRGRLEYRSLEQQRKNP